MSPRGAARRLRRRIGRDAQHSEWGERSDRVPLASTGVATDSPALRANLTGRICKLSRSAERPRRVFSEARMRGSVVVEPAFSSACRLG